MTAGEVSGVLVVVEQPVDRSRPVMVWVLVGQSASVVAQQVVRPVATCSRLVDEMIGVQGIEFPPCRRNGDVVQGGGSVGVQVRARM
jgi:hypothetical protein